MLIELTLCLRIHNQIEYEKNERIKWDRSIFIEACEIRRGKNKHLNNYWKIKYIKRIGSTKKNKGKR